MPKSGKQQSFLCIRGDFVFSSLDENHPPPDIIHRHPRIRSVTVITPCQNPFIFQCPDTMQNILYLAKKAPVVRAFCGPAGEDAKEIRENLLKNIVEEYDVDKATETMNIVDFEQRK